jgi:hypothetical protein
MPLIAQAILGAIGDNKCYLVLTFQVNFWLRFQFCFFHLKGTLVSVRGVKICHGTLVLEPVFHISISRLLILGFSKNKKA